ncbi:MAG TPA: hypothetical protein PLL10_07490, partial [Elusimicrobiales bacterium]|nr:hypothetical protein [Elusimicrobiales bacterium]
TAEQQRKQLAGIMEGFATPETKPELPSKFTEPGKAPPSFTLSDTVPQLKSGDSIPPPIMDPRMGEEAKSTMAPTDMLNLSKTTMYPAASEEVSVEQPEPKREQEKPVRSVKTLVLLLVAASLAVVAAIVFFFMREDAGVKGAAPKGYNSGMEAGTESSKPGPSQAAQPSGSPDSKQPELAQGATATTQLQPPEPVRTAAVGSKQAIEIAKSHDLGMGKGKLATWLTSSYGASGQEDWSATQLLGDIYVVQYRLLRPRAEPIVYQFEVNVAQAQLSKGINNAAIELLGGGSELPVAGRRAAKPAASRKPVDKRRRTAVN